MFVAHRSAPTQPHSVREVVRTAAAAGGWSCGRRRACTQAPLAYAAARYPQSATHATTRMRQPRCARRLVPPGGHPAAPCAGWLGGAAPALLPTPPQHPSPLCARCELQRARRLRRKKRPNAARTARAPSATARCPPPRELLARRASPPPVPRRAVAAIVHVPRVVLLNQTRTRVHW